MIKLITLFAIIILSANSLTAKAEPDPARFSNAITTFEKEDAGRKPVADLTLFTGSSSIRMWKSLTYGLPRPQSSQPRIRRLPYFRRPTLLRRRRRPSQAKDHSAILRRKRPLVRKTTQASLRRLSGIRKASPCPRFQNQDPLSSRQTFSKTHEQMGNLPNLQPPHRRPLRQGQKTALRRRIQSHARQRTANPFQTSGSRINST